MFEELEARSRLPQIGYQAPEFSAVTTFGPMKLSDFKGKWVVMFSHPGDFTPVIEVTNRIYTVPDAAPTN